MANNRVRKIGTDGIIATVAGTPGFSQPSGVAIDGRGNLYVLVPWGYLYKVTASGELLALPETGSDCGWPTSHLCGANGVAADRAGNLYVADTGHCRVLRLSADGEATTIAGDGRPSRSGLYTCGFSGD